MLVVTEFRPPELPGWKHVSCGTKADVRCRVSEQITCNFPVCAVISQRTLLREHTDISQLHIFMMKFTL